MKKPAEGIGKSLPLVSVMMNPLHTLAEYIVRLPFHLYLSLLQVFLPKLSIRLFLSQAHHLHHLYTP